MVEIPKDKYAALTSALQDTSKELGIDLEFLLDAFRPTAKETLRQEEARKFKALQSARAEKNRAEALALRAEKNRKKLEAELQEAKEDEEKARAAATRASEVLETAQEDYKDVQVAVAAAGLEGDADMHVDSAPAAGIAACSGSLGEGMGEQHPGEDAAALLKQAQVLEQAYMSAKGKLDNKIRDIQTKSGDLQASQGRQDRSRSPRKPPEEVLKAAEEAAKTA